MKNTKKLAAMIAALTLSVCSIAPMAMTASAADGKTSFALTAPKDFKGTIKADSIRAYKIFNISEDNTGITIEKNDDTVCVNAQNALLEALGTTIEKAGEKLSDIESNSDAAKAIAKKVAVATANDTAITADSYADGEVTFGSDLSDGYYIVLCSVTGGTVAGGEGEQSTILGESAESLAMLTVIDGKVKEIGALKNGEAKVGLPTVQKKVWEDDAKNLPANLALATHEETDKNWNDGADWAIGDENKFKLYGTLPEDYDNYDHYYYEFQDTLGKEFDLCNGLTFKVANTEITLTEAQVDALSADPTNIAGEDAEYEIWATKAVDSDSKTTLKITVEDMKALTKDNSDVVTVVYGAKLNNKAVVGSEGQRNSVVLNYSNNPNENYVPKKDDQPDKPDTPGNTPKDEVIVFTYALDFNKTFVQGGSDLTKQEIVDGTYDNIEFSLGDNIYVVDYDGDGPYDYVIVKDGTVEGAKNKMKLVLIDKDGTTITDGRTADTVQDTDKLVIRIKGLDSDTYKISETKAKNDDGSDKEFGYNLLDDKQGNVTIESGVTYQQAWDDFSGSKIYKEIHNLFDSTNATDENVVKVSGTVDGSVTNKKGSQLPSTGGIGTTIFYLGGGAMVAVAGVFLITKKRMGKEEN